MGTYSRDRKEILIPQARTQTNQGQRSRSLIQTTKRSEIRAEQLK